MTVDPHGGADLAVPGHDVERLLIGRGLVLAVERDLPEIGMDEELAQHGRTLARRHHTRAARMRAPTDRLADQLAQRFHPHVGEEGLDVGLDGLRTLRRTLRHAERDSDGVRTLGRSALELLLG